MELIHFSTLYIPKVVAVLAPLFSCTNLQDTASGRIMNEKSYGSDRQCNIKNKHKKKRKTAYQ